MVMAEGGSDMFLSADSAFSVLLVVVCCVWSHRSAVFDCSYVQVGHSY